jgi:thioesterase domain-containing protein
MMILEALPMAANGKLNRAALPAPGSGLSWCYMPLARDVPDDFRIYGLQARGLDGSGEVPGSVREMAADYIELIRTVQEAGPYYLLGWSSGAALAHEMAVQLQAAGEEVAALVLLDGYPASRRPDTGDVGQEGRAAEEQEEPEPDAEAEEARLGRLIERMRREAGSVLVLCSSSPLGSPCV